MMVGTGVGAIVVINIIIVGIAISIEIVTIVSVPIVIIVVDIVSAHVDVVVGPGTVECIPLTLIVRFTTVVVIIIPAIIKPAIIIPAISVSMIMSNTFLCCKILGVINCCTIDSLASSMCLYGSTRWGGSASVFFKGAGCCRAVHVVVVDIVDIRIGGGDISIIVGITINTIFIIIFVVDTVIIDCACRIVIIVARVLDSAIIT